MFFCAPDAKLLHTSHLKVSAVFWNRLCKCPGEKFGRKFFPEKLFPPFSLILSGKFSDFELTFLKQNLNEGHCTCPKKYNEGKRMRKTTVLFFFWGLWAEDFCLSDKIVDAVFSKLRFTYPEKKFGWICIRGSLVLYFYSVFQRKHFVLWVKVFSIFLKSASYVLVVFNWFLLETWRYQTLTGKFLVRLAMISFFQSEKLLEAKCFLKKKILVFFKRVLIKILSHIGRKPSGSPLEFALYVSIRSFLKRSFLEKKNFFQLRSWVSVECFQTFGKFFRHALHKLHLSFQRSMSEAKHVWEGREFYIFPEFWAGEFLTSDEIVEAVSTEMHPRFPEKSFGWFCFNEKIKFSFFSGLWARNFRPWSEKF